MSLAKNRAKRSTAGNRLSKLLENEDPEKHKDEFYQTAYGGFAEVIFLLKFIWSKKKTKTGNRRYKLLI